MMSGDEAWGAEDAEQESSVTSPQASPLIEKLIYIEQSRFYSRVLLN